MSYRTEIRSRGCGTARGFTLIELMIAVAIVALLATIALPSYRNAQIKKNRAAAETFLIAIAQQQQQYFIDNRSYAACTSVSTCVSGLGIANPSGVGSYYTVAVTVASSSPPGFTATATPITGTVQASDSTLSIDQTGAKTPAGVW